VARPRGPRTVRWLLIFASALVATTATALEGAAPSAPVESGQSAPVQQAPTDRRPPALPDAYLAELIAQSDALDLANAPQWWALLHYERRLTGRAESTVDSDNFLLAPDGRTDPRAELHATLARFFDPAATLKDGEPPQCALRGRYLWLDRRLHFDPARLPPQPCVAFDEWRAAIDPAGVTLVFPEAYMNNPSSMFGHTLLRIDSATGKDLLAYGSNYSADTGGDGGVAFAFKGILGYYDGRFAIYPYYDIIRQYGDWEQRDIWEYPLTFDADQTDLLLAHLWELRGVTFDYYFFDENCSYQILVLLDAARSGLDLQSQFRGWVIPADTVRAIVRTPDLVSGAAFRPSAATRLRHAATEMPHAQNALASAIADGTRPPDDPAVAALPDDAARAAVLGTAFELFRYRYLVDREATPDEQHRARAILLARSQVPFAGSGLEPVPTPAVPARPGPRQQSRARRHRRARRQVLRRGRHPADLPRPPRSRRRLHAGRGDRLLGPGLPLLHQGSRSARRALHAPRHHVAVAARCVLPPDLVDGRHRPRQSPPPQPAQRAHRGVHLALARRAGTRRRAVAARARLRLRRGDRRLEPVARRDHAIGPQGAVGLYAGPASDRWRAHLYGSVTGFVLGDTSQWYRGGLELRVTLTPQMALRGGVSGNRDFDQDWIEGGPQLGRVLLKNFTAETQRRGGRGGRRGQPPSSRQRRARLLTAALWGPQRAMGPARMSYCSGIRRARRLAQGGRPSRSTCPCVIRSSSARPFCLDTHPPSGLRCALSKRLMNR
jgi:hypothetical protein